MKYWTNKELARLKEVCNQPGVFAKHLPEFPGRTVESLRKQAYKRGYGKAHEYPGRPPVAQQRAMKLLDNRDMCRADIAKALGIAECTASEVLQRLRIAGKVYLKERRDGRGATKVWSSCDRLAEQVLCASPFGAAAGTIKAPPGGSGRVYRHLWDEPELEAA
jgi:DNA-binding transcriptional ArsR family regulator